MTMITPPTDGESVPSRPPRRRRSRSFLPFLGQEERDRTLDDLAQRAFPRLDFFLFTFLAALLFSLAQVLSWPVLWVLGVVLAPLLSPLSGAALGLVTSSLTFAARNLAALALAWILAFLGAWMIMYVGFVSDPGATYPLLEPVALFAIILASAWLTWRFVRGAADSWMPSAVVSYLCLYPLCVAGWTLAVGKNDAAVDALLAWAIRASLALIASMGTYLALGFRPSERNVRAYAGNRRDAMRGGGADRRLGGNGRSGRGARASRPRQRNCPRRRPRRRRSRVSRRPRQPRSRPASPRLPP